LTDFNGTLILSTDFRRKLVSNDIQFPTFHGILKFITLFNQIHMHQHHLHTVPLNTILPDSLRFSIVSNQDSQPVWPIIIYKIWVFYQKKIAVPFWTSLRQGHYTTGTTCTIKMAHHYLSLMITAIVLKQWIKIPSSHIYYCKTSLHSETNLFSILYTCNETVKQGMKWYFRIVSLHKHLFQLPSVGYQPMIQKCTSSPTWATSPLISELYKFNSTDNTSLSPCSPLLPHAQMFW